MKNLKLLRKLYYWACLPLSVFLKRRGVADKDDVFCVSFLLILAVSALDTGVSLE